MFNPQVFFFKYKLFVSNMETVLVVYQYFFIADAPRFILVRGGSTW